MPDLNSNNANQTGLATLLNLVQAVNALNVTETTEATDVVSAIMAINSTLSAFYPPPLTGSITWNPASIATGGSATTSFSVTGSALGNFVQPSFSLDLQGLTLTSYISAADTVTAVLANNTAGAVDLASGTLKVRVTQ